MFISLVIATYNRSELLPRSLQALTAQQTGGHEYEVVFVDDGSTDETPRLIEEAARHSSVIRYCRIEHTGSPARPRNVGAQQARGDVVVLVDDDVVPDPDFVRHHAEFHLQNPAVEEAALGELYLPDDVLRDPMSLFHTFPYHEVRHQAALSYLFFWTCNVSVKRRFLLEHGAFDEDAALHPLEDMECGFRLAQAGLRLRFLPHARGQHLHKLDPGAVPRKGHRTGRAQAALIRKVPDLALQRRFGILTWDSPWTLIALRLTRRAAFRLVDTPPVHALLRLLGAEAGHRSRASDLYYYLRFRRAVLEGFKEASADGRVRRPVSPRPVPAMQDDVQ